MRINARRGCSSPARIPLRQPMTSGHVRPSDVTAYDACLIASNGQFSKASSVLLTVLARNQKIGQQRNERGAKRLPRPRWTVGIGVVSYPLSCHGSHISACLGPFSLFARLSRVRNSNNEEESSVSSSSLSRSYPSIFLALPPPRNASSSFLVEISFQFHSVCSLRRRSRAGTTTIRIRTGLFMMVTEPSPNTS